MSADDDLAFAFLLSSGLQAKDGSPTFAVGPLYPLTPHKYAKMSVFMVISESQWADNQD